MASEFLAMVRRHMRLQGYSIRTEHTYIYWIRSFIRFNGLRHPQDLGADEVRSFLSLLANDRHVSVNTQKVALNTLVFF